MALDTDGGRQTREALLLDYGNLQCPFLGLAGGGEGGLSARALTSHVQGPGLHPRYRNKAKHKWVTFKNAPPFL
jgi:hypothetical protein